MQASYSLRLSNTAFTEEAFVFMGVGNKPHSADALEPRVSVSQAALGAGGARGAGGRHADGRHV